MVRLLYVIDSLAPGGAETSLVAMAPALIDLGIDLHVFPLGQALDLAAPLEAAGARVYTRTGRSGRLANVAAVRNLAETLRPDLVHTTLYEADIAGRTAARLLGIPSSTSLVSDSYGSSHYAETNTPKLHAARLVDAATARLAVRFHAITQAIADSVPPRIGVARDKVDVIPRGRDPQAFPLRTPAQTARVRAALGIDTDATVILAIGRLEPQKGLQHLLAALPSVAAANPGLVTLIAGKDGRAAAALKQQAQNLHLDVRFLGHRTDVPDLLAAADVFCFPSEREGFGGVLVEAFAVGCPVVASRIPTTVEVLGSPSGPVGSLADVGDAGALSMALRETLASPAAAAEQARRGRQHFEERFTIGATATQLHDFFSRAAFGDEVSEEVS